MKMIYRAVMFFMENIDRIAAFINSIVNSVAEIANGNIDKASDFIVSSIRRTIPIILSFFANMLGLGGISKKVQETIKKIRKPIDKVIDKALAWITKMIKKVFGKKKASGKADHKKKGKENKTQGKLQDTEAVSYTHLTLPTTPYV